MLKYGIYAKAVELLCFQPALEKLSAVYPENGYKKATRKNVKTRIQKYAFANAGHRRQFPGDESVYRSICLFSAQSRTGQDHACGCGCNGNSRV